MNDPLVSVLMPVYNAGSYLDSAITSILGQTFKEFEFVIVDDGSTDASSEILDRYAANDARIRIIRQANAGLLSALNTGLQQVRGKFIARMDADDISLPQRLEKQVAFLNAHPDCVLLGSQVLLITPDGLPVAQEFGLTSHDEIDSSNLHGRSGVAHPAAMIRRSALEKTGPYRGAFAEDLDLWLRLGEVGRLANLPEVLLKYRLNLGSLSFSKAYRKDEILWDFVAQAWERRKLGAAPRPAVIAPFDISNENMDAFWARAALRGGQFRSARILSRRALRRGPVDLKILATVALAHLGPIGRGLLKRKPSEMR